MSQQCRASSRTVSLWRGACARAWIGAGLVAVVVAPSRGWAAGLTAADLCPTAADPCVVSTKLGANADSRIDLGARALRIANGGRIDVGGGSLEILAGAVTIDPAGALRARGSNDDAGGTIVLAARSVHVTGDILADGAAGGSVELTADDASVAGTIRIDGLGPGSVGGELSIDAGTVTISGEISARAGNDGVAGCVDIAARDRLQLSGRVDAATGGGIVRLVAGLPLDVEVPGLADEVPAPMPGPSAAPRIDLTGVVDVRGSGEEYGGDVTLASRGDVHLAGEIDASGGSGGRIAIAAGLTGAGNVVVDPGATLDLTARAAESFAGDVQFVAAGDGVAAGHLTMNGQLLLRGPRDGGGGTIYGDLVSGDIRSQAGARYVADGGSGGSLYLYAGFGPQPRAGTIDVNAEIDLSAHDVAGCVEIAGRTVRLRGSLLMPGDLAVLDIAGTDTVRVEAAIDASGDSGSVTLSCQRGAVQLAGAIAADAAPTAADSGNGIGVDACTIDVEPTARLTAFGPAGVIELIGADETRVRGVLQAGEANVIRHGPGRPPIITGATIPTATLVADPSLATCAERTATPTGTPTATATPTVTAAPSATPTGPPTPVPTASATPTTPPESTATATPSRVPTDARSCPGDCGGDGRVSINDLILSVTIALGTEAPQACPSVDRNADGAVAVNELIAAVNAALEGCDGAAA